MLRMIFKVVRSPLKKLVMIIIENNCL